MIEMLASAGANLDAMDSSGRSALHYAAFEGHLGVPLCLGVRLRLACGS